MCARLMPICRFCWYVWSWGTYRSCLRQESDWIYHHFCRLSCLLAIQVTDRDGSIDDRSQIHSSFCMLQRAVSYNRTWLVQWQSLSNFLSENYHECLHTWRQFGSTCVGENSASTVYTPKQILRNQDNLVSWRNLQERCAITQDWHCRTIGWHLHKRSHTFCFWISPEEDNGMVIPPTPHYSNVLVPVSRGSVVPGHWNLDI